MSKLEKIKVAAKLFIAKHVGYDEDHPQCSILWMRDEMERQLWLIAEVERLQEQDKGSRELLSISDGEFELMMIRAEKAEQKVIQLRNAYSDLVTAADQRLCPVCDLMWSGRICVCGYPSLAALEK